MKYCVSLAVNRWCHQLVCKLAVLKLPLVRTHGPQIFGPQNTIGQSTGPQITSGQLEHELYVSMTKLLSLIKKCH